MKLLLLYLLAVLLSLLFPDPEKPQAPATLPILDHGLTVHFLDVGQADCALLECNGEFMIVDGGNVEDGRMVVSYLKQMGVQTLTSVVCSHAHEDHVGGLPAVLAVFDAERVYAPVTEYSSDIFENFVRYTEKQGLSLTVPEPGDQFMLGSAIVTVLGPTRDYEDPNNTSIILKVTYGESDFLFTGDMETLAEHDMLDYWGDRIDWDIEVLKVGHHCSDTSSGYRFVYETRPEYGVISVGWDNPYGHPHAEPMSRLKDAGLLLFRTDKLGHVVAGTDGSEITFTWESPYAAPEDAIPADPAMAILYGNKKTAVFHAYSCTSLPAQHNRVEFADYDEAIAAGYKPCGGCMG